MACGACANGWFSVIPCACSQSVKVEFVPYIQEVGWPVPASPGELPRMTQQPVRFPHKCPVCEGMGKFNDVYCTPNSDGQYKVVKCHACKGEGIVWG